MPTLFPYQEIGADWLAARSTGMLLDGMRVGKTPQALRAAERKGARKVTVVCPAIARTSWRRKIETWAPGLEVLVESYDRLTANATVRDAFHRFRPDVLIIDEAQYARTRTAQRTQMLYGPKCEGKGGLVDGVPVVWQLSGTISPTNSGDLWPHLRAVFNLPLGYWPFVSRYHHVYQGQFGMEIGGLRPEHTQELIDLLRPLYLRRKFAEVHPDAGKPRLTELEFDVDKKTLAAIDAQFAGKTIPQDPAQAMEWLRKNATNTAELRRIIGLAKAVLVADYTADLCLDSKVVVFAWHQDVIREIAIRLGKEIGMERVAMIYGPTSERERVRIMDDFQDPNGKIRVIVGQIQTLGTAIELDAADHAVFAEFDWNPANIVQAVHRLVNLNNPRPVDVAIASLAGSVDDRVTRAAIAHARTTDTLFN